jgi:arylsulfatase A-like enzyme
LRGFKGQVWEGGHRVPAIARWTGQIEAGSVCDQAAISLDLMPTMLELAGADVPAGHKLDGTSLVPMLLKGESLGSRKLFWEYNGKQAMRDGPWKLVVGEKGAEAPALFRLDDDLGEKADLATAQSQRVGRMVAELEAWHADVLAGATQQPEKAEE